MKRIYYIIFVLVLSLFAQRMQAQQWKPYVILDTIPIKSGTKKAKLYRLATKWLEEERGTKLIAKNRKQRKLIGRGYFIYNNRIKLPGVFLSPRANERTKGSIMFQIDIHIQDSIIVVKHSRFIHEAAFSEYGSMSFGLLMDYSKVPPGKCMEIEEWCNAVWFDMKKQSELEIKWRLKRMIPALLVRKRTFRLREEVVVADSTEVVDPNAYLEFEKYIIHDRKEPPKPPPVVPTEPQVDEDGEIVEPEQEVVSEDGYEATDEVESSSKKGRKKGKEDDDEEPAEMVIGDQAKKSKKEEKQKVSEDEATDDDYEETEPESKESSEKKVKEKKESKPKEKKAKESKSKKSKASEEDDDYDDYDDYDDE